MSTRPACIALCLAIAASAALARTKDKPAEKDSFDLVGHLALDGKGVTSAVITSHFSRSYLYTESSAAHTVTVIDTTDAARPKLLSSVSGSGSLLTAAGDVALISSESRTAVSAARTISIVDFSDKSNPKVVREFAGVTSITSDDRRGLVFLTNGEGLWILRRNQPLDPEIQERYAHDVVYNH